MIIQLRWENIQPSVHTNMRAYEDIYVGDHLAKCRVDIDAENVKATDRSNNNNLVPLVPSNTKEKIIDQC